MRTEFEKFDAESMQNEIVSLKATIKEREQQILELLQVVKDMQLLRESERFMAETTDHERDTMCANDCSLDEARRILLGLRS